MVRDFEGFPPSRESVALSRQKEANLVIKMYAQFRYRRVFHKTYLPGRHKTHLPTRFSQNVPAGTAQNVPADNIKAEIDKDQRKSSVVSKTQLPAGTAQNVAAGTVGRTVGRTTGWTEGRTSGLAGRRARNRTRDGAQLRARNLFRLRMRVCRCEAARMRRRFCLRVIFFQNGAWLLQCLYADAC